jgi:outer membrane protein assembly factor BamB
MSGKIGWKKYESLLFVVLLTSVSAIPFAADAADSAVFIQSPIRPLNDPRGNDWWPMFRHDVTHDGFSTTTAPEDNQVLWSYQTNYVISSSPAVSHGKIYIGSWDWNIYCLDMDSGSLIWNYSTAGEVTSSPAVAVGKVYVGSQDTKLYCLNAIDGTFLWGFKTDFIIDTSPTVLDDKVFFGSSDGSLYCLEADNGYLLWEYQTGSVIVSSPAVTEGKVYFGVTNGDFLCVDSNDGSLIWTYTMTDGSYSSPTVFDGKIYFGSNDKNVYCLDANDGSLIWNYSAQSEVHSSPAVAYDYLYIGTSDGRLLCLNRNTGGFVWSYLISGSVESSPAVADGKVYFGTNPCCGFSSYFICLDAFSGTKIWDHNFNLLTGSKSSAALAASKVFVGSADGKVYAFGDSEFLADANGPYHGFINTVVDFTGSVHGGEPGFSWYWDFGDNTTSTEQNPTHAYASLGEYTVTLTVTDSTGDVATDETSVSVETPNLPPEIPTVDGPTTGRPGESYEYTFTSFDPNGDHLFYNIMWGDNTTSGWIGPFASGVVVKREHAWSEKGSYIIKAKAKDNHGVESDWSGPFEMTITAPELDIEIKGVFGVTVTIINAGDAPATNVSWNITFDSGFVIPAFKYGMIPMIPAGGQAPIRVLVFGFGKKTVTLTVMCDEAVSVKKIVQASLLLFFVIGVK